MWYDNEDCKYNCLGACSYPSMKKFQACSQENCPIVHPEFIDIDDIEQVREREE